MKIILLTTIVLTMNCFGNQLECRIEPSSKFNHQDLLQIDADYEKNFPEMGGNLTYTLCQLGQRVAVIIQNGGSGLYVYSMRIYVKVDKEWAVVKFSRMSTGSAQNSPAKVTLNHNVVTIYSRDDKVIDSFDVSGYEGETL